MFKCDKCGADLEQNAKFCTNCGEKVSEKTIEQQSAKQYEGLGGWLILVGIGVVLSPFRILADISKIYLPIFKDGTWDALTDPTSEVYNSSFSILLTGEIVFNSIMILVSFYMIYLFFAKKKLFPKFYIWTLIISFIFIILDALVVSVIFPNTKVMDIDTAKELFRIFIVGIIWIPYMIKSKRVKATFIK